jgi:hypothetical protein
MFSKAILTAREKYLKYNCINEVLSVEHAEMITKVFRFLIL